MRPPSRRRILTVAERQQFQAELGVGALGLDASDVAPGGVWYESPHDQPLNPVELAAKRRRTQAILDAGSPHDESRSYKAARDKRIRLLEEELRKDVIPSNHFHLKRQDTTDYNKVVTTLVGQMSSKRRREIEDELKNLRREREPDDPNAGKLVDLREDRRITA